MTNTKTPPIDPVRVSSEPSEELRLLTAQEIMGLAHADLAWAYAQLQCFAAEVYRDGYGSGGDGDECPLAAAADLASEIVDSMIEITARASAAG